MVNCSVDQTMNDHDLTTTDHLMGTYKDGRLEGTNRSLHHVGSAPSIPTDITLWKSQSLDVMKQYTDEQLQRLSEHAELIIKQVREILDNQELAMRVTLSDFKFEPVAGREYYLYEHIEGAPKIGADDLLTICPPYEFNKCYKSVYRFVTAVRFRADRTWEPIEHYVMED